METLNTLVIENTRSCNLRCKGCPTTYSTNYPAGFMPLKVFYDVIKNISPDIFPNCALMGWGEPFLDKNYLIRLKLLKQQGYKVGSTTNSTLLTSKIMRSLIEEGLDQLNISWDVFHMKATNTTCYEMGKKLEKILNIIPQKKSKISIMLNIVLTKSTTTLLLDILSIIKDLPIKGVGVVPLIMLPTQKLLKELIPINEMQTMQQKTQIKFPQLTIDFPYLTPSPSDNCRSDIFKNVYITYTGEVIPCCILAMEFPNYTFDRKKYKTSILSFGNLTKHPFYKIWNSNQYKNFRLAFKQKKRPVICNCCNVWRLLPSN